MQVAAWIQELYALGVKVWVDGESLRYRIPKSQAVRQAEILGQLKNRKAEVMEYLRNNTLERANAQQIEPVDRRAELPLSFVQEQLWFLDQLEGHGSAAYSVPIGFRLRGELDVDLFRISLQQIIDRHEALRSRFPERLGNPSLEIGDAEVHLECFDVAALSEQDKATQTRIRINAALATPFDLQHGPLFKAQLHRWHARDWVVLFNMHHIVSDGWSTSILLNEWSALYTALRSGQTAELPQLKVQYVDFAHWQRRQIRGNRLERGFAFWENLLQDAPLILPLPIDKPRPAVKRFVGTTHLFYLDPPLARKIKALSRQQDCTVFVTLLSAWYVLLSHYSGTHDMVIGCPVASRNHPDTEPLIGFFINTLAMRINQDARVRFTDLLDAVKHLSLDAFAHQDVPFEALVRRLQPERSLSHTPVFQVAFALQNEPLEMIEVPEFDLEPFDLDIATSKFDLTLSLMESGDRFEALLEYDTDLFQASTMERLGMHFTNLLNRLSENPQARIHRVDYLATDEKVRIHELATGPRPEAATASLLQQFEAIVGKCGDRMAIVEGTRRWSYGELQRQANQLAHHLLAVGVQREEPVGLYFDRSAQMILSMLGVLKAGGCYLPMDTRQPAERLRYMIDSAGIRHLITSESQARELDAPNIEILQIDRDWSRIVAGLPTTTPQGPVMHPEALVYAIYTSGSTGLPKCVEIAERGLRNLVDWHRHTFHTSNADRTLWVSGTGFDASVWELWPALLSGACIFIVPEHQSPEAIQACIREHRITSCFLPTPIGEALLQLPWPEPTALTQVFLGGDRLHLFPAPLLPFRVYNGYGPTENSVVSTCGRVPVAGERAGLPMIGRPIFGTTAYVLDQYQQLVPIGIPGELCLGGRGLARGYKGKPGMTAERFIPHPFARIPGERLYRTGDTVRMLANGEIEFLGRLDRQVKIRGFRIEPGEIEAAIRALSPIEEVVVDVAQSRVGTSQLVAWIRCNQVVSDASLREYLLKRLPEYMIPSHWVHIEQIPLNKHGKVDYTRLPQPEHEAPQGAMVAPLTPMQRLLAAIWCTVLGLEQVGIGENFFALGGHSLLATQVISRIRTTCKVEVPLKLLFEHPTIESLAPQVERVFPFEDETIVPCRLEGYRPLSYAQERLWFLDQLVPDSAFYNIFLSLHLQGELDLQALEHTFQTLVQRHEALHCSFVDQDGTPALSINPATPLPLRQVELAADDPAADSTLTAIAHEEAHRPFDLTQAPLIRVTLVRQSAESHVLLITLHHIIADGWSVGVMSREIACLYNSFVRSEPANLPELTIQYSDFALWQRGFLAGARLEGQLQYWRQQLAGLEVLTLPTDQPRPAVATYAGARETLWLAKATSDQLQAFSLKMDVSLFMTLFAAFAILLHRYSGQDDIAVGSPIANRNRQEIEPLIGFFVNTLILRLNLGGRPTIRELLNRVRRTTLAAFDHQDLPFEQIVHELKPVRDTSRNPLFQVLFALQNAGSGPLHLDGLEIKEMALAPLTVRLDLELHVFATDAGLEATMLYNTDLFRQKTIRNFQEGWRKILDQMVNDPDIPLDQLRILSRSQRHNLLVNWNGREVRYPQVPSMHLLFEQQVPLTPERICLIFGEQQLTYAELAARVDRVAAWLQQRGLGPEKLIGVCLHQSIERLVVTLALHKAGAAFLPLDLRFPEERLRYMIADSGIRAMIGFSDQEAHIAQLAPQLEMLRIDEIEPQLTDALVFQPPPMSPDQLAYVIYTSGSTGTPKGIAVRHEVIINMVRYQIELSREAHPVRTLQFAPLIFDIVFQEMFATWHVGGTLVLASEEDRANPEQLVRLLNEQKIERFFLPYIALRSLAESDALYDWPQDCLKEIITAGEQLQVTEEIRAFFRKRPQCRLYNQYGPSECHVVTSYTLERSVDNWVPLPPIGRPLDNVKIYLLDQSLNLVPPGVIGEVYIAGSCLARGYLNKPALTAAAFIPNPFASAQNPGSRLYKTGDLASYNQAGQLEFVGRIDSQVKIRGYRIELNEIEVAAKSHAIVREAVVAVEELGEGNRHLVLYVVFEPEAKGKDPAVVRQALAAWLPEYMIPTLIVELERLPVTTGGKIDRQALPRGTSIRQAETHVPPRTPVEKRLCAIWQTILQTQSIGVRDHFFELGGNSLMAVRLMAAIQREWDQQLPLALLFQRPTIEAIAAMIEAACLPQDNQESILVPLQTQGEKPPIFLIHPGSGSVFCYKACAQHLDPSFSVYAIQSPGFLKDRHLPSSLPEIAALYLEAIGEVQPHGPYRIGGWCMGGTIAFEMASQLQQQGEDVNLLFMINTYVPVRHTAVEILGERDLLHLFLLHLLRFDSDTQPDTIHELLTRREEPIAAILRLNRETSFLGSSYEETEFRQLFQVFSSIVNAIMNYEPPTIQGDLVYFEASECIRGSADDLSRGWRPKITGNLRSHQVTGNHYTLMDEPNVRQWVRTLNGLS